MEQIFVDLRKPIKFEGYDCVTPTIDVDVRPIEYQTVVCIFRIEIPSIMACRLNKRQRRVARLKR